MDPRRHRQEQGFTVIEVLVALVVLLVGLVSTLALVNAANGRSVATKGREGATNLGREVAEQVRMLSYSELTGGLIPVRLQARPELADASTAAGWQVSRRGFDYTIATAVCSIDAPGDKLGDHGAGGFCADSSATGTDDATPEDLKRVTVTTSFQDRGRTITTRSVTTVNSTGQSTGLPVSGLVLHATNPATPITPSPTEPVIGTSVSNLVFRATAPAAAVKVQWNVEGRKKTPDATKIDATTWEFSWPVTGLSDGTYGISAQAVDAKGEIGPPREIPVRLARNVPPAVTDLVAGYNTVFDAGTSRDVAELEWTASPERNVEGYRVYRADNTLACPASTSVISAKTSCIDFTPPATTATAAARTYRVVGLYRNAANTLMETAAATKQVDPVTWTTTVTNPPTTANTDHQFNFMSSTTNTGAPCAGGELRDMRDGVTGTTGSATGQNKIITWCGPAISMAANQTMAIPAFPATSRLYIGAEPMIGGEQCTVTQRVLKLGATNATLATTSTSFSKDSPNFYASWSPSLPATTLVNGDRLAVQAQLSGQSGCAKLDLFYGGTTNQGELDMRTSTTTTTTSTVTNTSRPNPVTGLTATPQADGSVKLTWNKPAGGPAVDFYRIYKNGTNHTDRLTTATVDATVGATTDSELVNGGTATYRVTAVSPALAESTFSTAVSVP